MAAKPNSSDIIELAVAASGGGGTAGLWDRVCVDGCAGVGLDCGVCCWGDVSVGAESRPAIRTGWRRRGRRVWMARTIC